MLGRLGRGKGLYGPRWPSQQRIISRGAWVEVIVGRCPGKEAEQESMKVAFLSHRRPGWRQSLISACVTNRPR